MTSFQASRTIYLVIDRKGNDDHPVFRVSNIDIVVAFETKNDAQNYINSSKNVHRNLSIQEVKLVVEKKELPYIT